MGYRILIAAAFLAAALTLGASLARASGPLAAPSYSELLVRFRPTVTESDRTLILSTLGLNSVGYNSDLRVYHVRAAPGGDLAPALAALQVDTRVALAEPNHRVAATSLRPVSLARFFPLVAAAVNDPLYGEQWGLQRIQAARTWPAAILSGRRVTIAIADTGVDLTHPDLRPRLLSGYNWFDPLSPPQDDMGHGTEVAGVAAAVQNNRIGIAGTAANVMILPVKILDSSGSGTEEGVADGIRAAARRGARVINLSLGAFTYNSTCPRIWQEAISFAAARGAVVVAAAGNYGENEPFFPAACAHVIAVGWSDYGDQPSFMSNYGSWVDVAAPGDDILSTALGGGYDVGSGSSFSTPFVSGTAAMLLIRNPGASPDQVNGVIRNSADPVPALISAGLGTGRLNAARAVLGPR